MKLSQLAGKTGWNLQSTIEYQSNGSLEIVVGCVIGQFCRQFPQLEDKSIINECGKSAAGLTGLQCKQVFVLFASVTRRVTCSN